MNSKLLLIRISRFFHSLFLCILIAGLAGQLAAQGPPEKPAETTIESVKLHLEGAEIFQHASVRLVPGRNEFKFGGISSKLYPSSLQVQTSAETVKVLSVTSKLNYLVKKELDQQIRNFQDTVEMVKDEISSIENERSAYMEEKNLMNENQKFKGDDRTLTVEELKATAVFYHDRAFAISKGVAELEKKLVKKNQKLFDLKLQLRELNESQEPSADIIVVLEAKAAIATSLTIRYVVSDAGWAAIYDLEAGDLSGPMVLGYRALAFNNTGVDWKNVNLTLATGDPLQTATQPALGIWDVDRSSEFKNAGVFDLNLMNDKLSLNLLKSESDSRAMEQTEMVPGYSYTWQSVLGSDYKQGVDYNTELFRKYNEKMLSAPVRNTAMISAPSFNVEFEIAQPFTIPSDRKPYSIDITEYKLEATYKYFAVPKLDDDAFLLAQIVGWEDLNLVSGPVNLYNGRNYIGQSFLDIRNISDTLNVSLGRDKDVVVTRLKIQGKSKRSVFGASKKVSVAYNFSARNNHNAEISIEILDQLPITSDREVFVTLDESSGASFEEKTGRLTWNLTLQPAETKTFEFGYSIRYPPTRADIPVNDPSRSVQQERYF